VAGRAVDAKAEELEEQKAKVHKADVFLKSVDMCAFELHRQVGTSLSQVRDIALASASADASSSLMTDRILGALEGRAETPLIAAVPAAFALPATERSEFDCRVVSEVSRIVAERVTELEAQLAATEEEAEFEEADRLGAWAMLDVERDCAAEFNADFEGARAAYREAEAVAAAASSAVNSLTKQATAFAAEEALAQQHIVALGAAADALHRLIVPPPPSAFVTEEQPPLADADDATCPMNIDEHAPVAAEVGGA